MPWQLSYAAMAESDNAELQTDVMRFMAILAFCLVAVFAIVQSIPATPAPTATVVETPPDDTGRAHSVALEAPPHRAQDLHAALIAAPAAEQAGPPAASRTSTPAPLAGTPAYPAVTPSAPPERRPGAATARDPSPPPVVLQRARPSIARADRSKESVVLRRAIPLKVAQVPGDRADREHHRPPQTLDNGSHTTRVASTASEPRTDTASTPQGLSLRFESDAVLRSLVARGLISLYAIAENRYYAMVVDGNAMRFVATEAPARYHEMFGDTVPAEVIHSFRQQHRGSGPAPVWGVTLPAATAQQLQRFVRTRFSGGLVITADAGLALAGV